jgi:hypothetical protein
MEYSPGYPFGSLQSQPQAKPDNFEGEKLTWLDYIILSNPQGVMKVLNAYGYTGYLAPQNEDEMIDACMDIMDKYEDQAVIDLLKSNPIYDLVKDLSSEESKIGISFKNASGEDGTVFATIRTINYKKLLENVLIIIGAFYVGSFVWKFFTGKNA